MENQKNRHLKIIVHPASLKQSDTWEGRIEVKPYSSTELGALYGVSCRTFSNWTKPFEKKIGTKIGRFYTVRQVRIIFDHLDVPYMLDLPISFNAA